MKNAKCYNCKYAGEQFKISKLTHLHCEDPEEFTQEKYENGELSPWDSLRVFSDTCDRHEFRK